MFKQLKYIFFKHVRFQGNVFNIWWEKKGLEDARRKSARKQILEAKFLTSKLSLVGFGKCLSLEVTKYKLYEVCLGVCRSDAIPWREEALDKFSASASAALVCITKKRYSEFCPPKLSKEDTLSSINLWLFFIWKSCFFAALSQKTCPYVFSAIY